VLAKVTREEKKDLALSYGTVTGLVWGLLVTLQGFRSPLTFEWTHWCALLVGGILAGFIPFACLLAADWLDARTPVRQQDDAA